jgi:hypothetical protein
MSYGKYIRIKKVPNYRAETLFIKKNGMDQEIEKRLWEYIEGHCSAAEKAIIMQQISDDPVWNKKYTDLMSFQELLQKEELEVPSLRFTKNVMEDIAQYHVAPATKNYINKNVIRGIAGFFLAMIIGLCIYFVGQIHWSGSSTDNLVPAYTLDVSKLNWSKVLNNTYVNIFVGINVILGLILVDKFMQGKKKASRVGRWSEGDSA